ncbi:EamA-like transporter family protein [Rubripirellula obstinata]|uniref:EamA-like transporter family protein n=1 Tax=Rubripirellula obstinata TaxID=406547 RepID=A0A5B1CQL9_9BACT|nr:EamA family transporter RarD [Rubripirellula obstinata]KAA1262541.1 EamA-like transporter family protein [Rubripirellula obstinata]
MQADEVLTSTVSVADGNRHLRVGIASVLLAHVIWGFFPLYWRLLGSISAFSLTAHRIVWSFLIAALLCTAIKPLRNRLWRRHPPRTLAIHAIAAFMIGINWVAFLYAVNSGHVLQSALGYYINPLVNVMLGVVILKERLTRLQTFAVVLAAIGVSVMSLVGDGIPWLSLVMAFSFGFYALLKKQASLGAIEGLTLETGTLLPFALCYLLWLSPGVEMSVAPAIDPGNVPSATAAYSAGTWAMLIFGGALTLSPLTLFAFAAPRVPLSMIGILQYIGPTLQWICGAVLLSEPVSKSQLAGFGFVWAGILVFVVSGLRQRKQNA